MTFFDAKPAHPPITKPNDTGPATDLTSNVDAIGDGLALLDSVIVCSTMEVFVFSSSVLVLVVVVLIAVPAANKLLVFMRMK